MSVLLFGVSHRSAPVSVLERLAISEPDRPKIFDKFMAAPNISEAMIVSTCNRIEIYVVVGAFHPALEAVEKVLSEHSGLSINEMTAHAYVRYSESAAEHLFNVAAGLDSLVVGEQQILGQIRSAYASADAKRTAGRVLHELAQQALRVGKRVHTETGIDRAGASVVSVALHRAHSVLDAIGAQARRGVVLGAGAMGQLSSAHLAREGFDRITIVNRNADRAQRLACNIRTNHPNVIAVGVGLDDLSRAMAQADVMLTCSAGSVGSVVTVAEVNNALAARTITTPLVVCDLGLPRNVAPATALLPGVELIDIEGLRDDTQTQAAEVDVASARAIVAAELADYLAAQRRAEVTPTVTALRQHASEVVDAEIKRLDARLPRLSDTERDEVTKTIRRVVDKLLHVPTVRVKQLAATANGDQYAEALRELFELRPGAAESVAAPDFEPAILGEQDNWGGRR